MWNPKWTFYAHKLISPGIVAKKSLEAIKRSVFANCEVKPDNTYIFFKTFRRLGRERVRDKRNVQES